MGGQSAERVVLISTDPPPAQQRYRFLVADRPLPRFVRRTRPPTVWQRYAFLQTRFSADTLTNNFVDTRTIQLAISLRNEGLESLLVDNLIHRYPYLMNSARESLHPTAKNDFSPQVGGGCDDNSDRWWWL